MVVFHDIIRVLHANLFIKGNGIFVCHEIYSDILFTVCQIKCSFYKLFSDALSFTGSLNAQICDVKPVSIIR